MYNKSDGNASEIQKTRLSKLHSLPQTEQDYIKAIHSLSFAYLRLYAIEGMS